MSQLLCNMSFVSAVGVNESQKKTLSGGSAQLHFDYEVNVLCCAYFSCSRSMHQSVRTKENILTILHPLIKSFEERLVGEAQYKKSRVFSVQVAPLSRSISFTSAIISHTLVFRNYAYPTTYGCTHMVRNRLSWVPATSMLRKCTEMAPTGCFYLASHVPGHESREIQAS